MHNNIIYIYICYYIYILYICNQMILHTYIIYIYEYIFAVVFMVTWVESANILLILGKVAIVVA